MGILESALEVSSSSLAVLVSSIGPVVGQTAAGGKFSGRLVRSVRSFSKGGFYNPSFYANSAATGLSLASYGLQVSSHVTRTSCPVAALPLYTAAQLCSIGADVIDRTFSYLTYLI